MFQIQFAVYIIRFIKLYIFSLNVIRHLMEDLKEVYTQEQIDRMSAEEKDFHYFK